MSDIGHNSGDALNQSAQSALKAIFERIENVDQELADLRESRAEILADAKAQGFNKSIIAAVIRLRRKDAAKRREEQDLIDQYFAAIEPLPLFEHANAEPAAPEMTEAESEALETYQRIKAAVIASGDASIVAITALVGKNSAARPILKMLEADGVVSAPDSRNRRTVLIPSNL